MKTRIAIILLFFLVITSLYLHYRIYSTGIYTRRLALHDGAGHISGIWSLENGNNTLSMFNSNMEPRIVFGATDSHADFILYDHNNLGRIFLNVDSNNLPRIRFFDTAEKVRLLLGQSDDITAIILTDSNEVQRISIEDEVDSRRIVLFNNTGRPILGLLANTNDLSRISLWDSNGYRITTLPTIESTNQGVEQGVAPYVAQGAPSGER